MANGLEQRVDVAKRARVEATGHPTVSPANRTTVCVVPLSVREADADAGGGVGEKTPGAGHEPDAPQGEEGVARSPSMQIQGIPGNGAEVQATVPACVEDPPNPAAQQHRALRCHEARSRGTADWEPQYASADNAGRDTVSSWLDHQREMCRRTVSPNNITTHGLCSPRSGDGASPASSGKEAGNPTAQPCLPCGGPSG